SSAPARERVIGAITTRLRSSRRPSWVGSKSLGIGSPSDRKRGRASANELRKALEQGLVGAGRAIGPERLDADLIRARGEVRLDVLGDLLGRAPADEGVDQAVGAAACEVRVDEAELLQVVLVVGQA